MADTETTNYNFIKPEVGSSLWGAKLNTDMDSIDEEIKTVEDAVDTKADSSHTHTESDITDLDHEDFDAVHIDGSNELDTVVALTTIDSLDLFLIEDESDGYDKKKIPFSVISSGVGASTAIHTDESGEIEGLSEITDPYSTDIIILEDSSDSFSKAKGTLRETQSVRVSNVSDANSWDNTSSLTTYYSSNGGDFSGEGIRIFSVIRTRASAKFELDSGTITLHVGEESEVISSLGSYLLDIEYNAFFFNDGTDRLCERTILSLYTSSTMTQYVLTNETTTVLTGIFKFQFSAASGDNTFNRLFGYTEILSWFEAPEEG